jgi:hypothetical protein
MEMRREIRYRLGAPVLFSWESGRHEHFQGEGVTRDISVFGAFILTSTCPPVEVPVKVEVALPSIPGLYPAMQITGEARVLRVDNPSKGKNGFAMVSEDFSRWSMKSGEKEFAPRLGENSEAYGRKVYE